MLVCNTGGPPLGPDPLGFAREQWEAAYRELVLSPMAMVEAAMPDMREHGFGRVVNVASSSVREPLDGLMLSNAHRASMVTAFKTIARQVAADGVTLNTLLTGRIATQRLADSHGSLDAAREQARKECRRRGSASRGHGRGGGVPVLGACGLCDGRDAAVDGGLMRSVF